MTLTLEEEQIFRKQIEVQKLEQQLQNLVLTKPVLTPTKDAEISTLKQQIKAEEVHTARTEYIKKVQPMKDNCRVLIAQNKQIEVDNKAAIDIARSTDDLARQEILDSINTAKNELNTLLSGI
jgi:hypothetical protein